MLILVVGRDTRKEVRTFINIQPRRRPFTVACSVTCLLNGSEAGCDLVFTRLINTSLLLFCKSSCSYVSCNCSSFHLNEKSREFYIYLLIKARSPLASLELIGQVTTYKTVKWPIYNDASQSFYYYNFDTCIRALKSILSMHLIGSMIHGELTCRLKV